MNIRMGYGLIPALWHFEISPFLGIIYTGFTWSMLLKYLRKGKYSSQLKIKYWLIVFCSFVTVIYISLSGRACIILYYLHNHGSELKSNYFGHYFMSVVFLGLIIYLFFNPEILYGISIFSPIHEINILPEKFNCSVEINQPVILQSKSPFDSVIKQYTMPNDIVLGYSKRLQSLIEEQQLFRQQGLTIHMLAEKSGISPRNVSYVLNHHHKQRFNDYINAYRINYILKRFKNNDWQVMSIEGLSIEAGFSSRNTFLLAFKKNVGLPPSDYIERLKKEQKPSCIQPSK